MTANITDLTRVTATIACSGAATTNPITNSVLRTALGYGASGLCTIGSSDGYYTQFGFRVDTTGGRTWDFAVDEVGDGTYTTLKTGLASGASVTCGIIPGAFSDGTVVGSRRPYAFLVTLSSADADSVISLVATRVVPNDALRVSADLTATNTAIAAVSTKIGTPVTDVSTDIASIVTKIGTPADGSVSSDIANVAYVTSILDRTIIATGTLDGAFSHTTTVIQCSTLSGTTDYYGSGCRVVLYDSTGGGKSVRTISSYSTANKRLTLSVALPWTPVNGDTFVIIPA